MVEILLILLSLIGFGKEDIYIPKVNYYKLKINENNKSTYCNFKKLDGIYQVYKIRGKPSENSISIGSYKNGFKEGLWITYKGGTSYSGGFLEMPKSESYIISGKAYYKEGIPIEQIDYYEGGKWLCRKKQRWTYTNYEDDKTILANSDRTIYYKGYQSNSDWKEEYYHRNGELKDDKFK